MNRLQHNGYHGSVEYSAEDDVLHGRVLNISDIVTYEGSTLEEIKAHFREAVDGYLRMCTELGEAPDRPASGRFNVRIDPELHRAIQAAAARKGESLNEIVAEALRKYACEHAG